MRTLTFGEILWDIIDGKEFIGGAPFNLAAHLAKMGAISYLISAVGKDELGYRALNSARAQGLRDEYLLTDPNHPTGTVNVELDEQGKPTYTIHEDVAWDFINPSESMIETIKARQWDAVSFGTLAQRTEENQRFLLDLLDQLDNPTVLYDVNIRLHYYTKSIIESGLERSSVVKLNDEEAELLRDLFVPEAKTMREISEGISLAYGIETVIITRGGDGHTVLSGGSWYDLPGRRVKVVDTVGAGDSFSAGFLFARHHGNDVRASIEFAATMGAYLVTQHGAFPEYSPEIQREVEKIRTLH
ncbi:MAG: carbohydrate kinase [Spirochaetales bacterium]|nr:carbohydrate kinase [Spirochaetales bacterium]MCF7938638.1 carbohydrate kinase [Spirochaetales bacterium]